MGHTNNAAYFTFMEEARLQMARTLFGMKGTEILTAAHFPFIIAELSCTFLKPTTMNQEISILADVTSVGTKSFTIDYDLKNPEGESVAKGKSVLVWYDYKNHKTVPIPEEYSTRLKS